MDWTYIFPYLDESEYSLRYFAGNSDHSATADPCKQPLPYLLGISNPESGTKCDSHRNPHTHVARRDTDHRSHSDTDPTK